MSTNDAPGRIHGTGVESLFAVDRLKLVAGGHKLGDDERVSVRVGDLAELLRLYEHSEQDAELGRIRLRERGIHDV